MLGFLLVGVSGGEGPLWCAGVGYRRAAPRSVCRSENILVPYSSLVCNYTSKW